MKSGKRKILLSILLIGCVLWVNAQKRPVIGISDTHRDGTNAAVPRSYVNAVLLNGGIPVVIPLMNDDNELIELLNALDGVIFTGGEDFDPAYYNERPIPQMGTINASRDRFDIKLLNLAAERGVPILGICRGVQLINIAFGGSLYQDLPAQYHDTSIRHRQRQSNTETSHAVIVEENTAFSDIVKERMLMVNSFHHQAVKDVARGFRVAGKSPDKIVEVIEKIDDDNWILGVQFHPELRVTNDLAMRRIFQSFIEEAGASSTSNRFTRPLIASRPGADHDVSQETQFNRPSSATSEIVYKNIIDTQYIYKFIRDTLYVPIPTDTVYIAIDTINDSNDIVSIPPDLASIPVEIEYFPAADTACIPVEIEYVFVVDTASIPDKTIDIQPDTASIPAIPIFVFPETSLISSDTLIYTPGVSTNTATTKKSDVSKSNKKREEKAKQVIKREDDERNKQIQKELVEKTNQKEKEKKKLDEKEKYEKKAVKVKEKQFQQQQKENAKLDKKELKLRKRQGTMEKD